MMGPRRSRARIRNTGMQMAEGKEQVLEHRDVHDVDQHGLHGRSHACPTSGKFWRGSDNCIPLVLLVLHLVYFVIFDSVSHCHLLNFSVLERVCIAPDTQQAVHDISQTETMCSTSQQSVVLQHSDKRPDPF